MCVVHSAERMEEDLEGGRVGLMSGDLGGRRGCVEVSDNERAALLVGIGW